VERFSFNCSGEIRALVPFVAEALDAMTTRDVSKKREQRLREKRARVTLDFPRDEDDDDAEENAGEQMFLCECSSAIWTVRMYSVKDTKRGRFFFFCADDVWLRNKLSLKLSACARVCLYSNKN